VIKSRRPKTVACTIHKQNKKDKISIAQPHRKPLNTTNGLNGKTHTDLLQTYYKDMKRTEMVAANATRFKTTKKLLNTTITAKYLKKTFKM
jgi:hypothetical protein